MEQILVYADSLTWGIIPDTRNCLAFEERWPGMPVPEIMVVAPPKIIQPQGAIADKFQGAEKRDAGLAEELAKLASELSTHYFNAATVTEASAVDGIHLDRPQHARLGEAIADAVSSALKL